jgi:hypothetical protein
MDKTGQSLRDFCTDGLLKPALASIQTACKYLGGVSRAKFYSDILPELETVHVGARHHCCCVIHGSTDREAVKQRRCCRKRSRAAASYCIIDIARC